MRLDDKLTARLTQAFGPRIMPDHESKMVACGKVVSISAQVELRPEMLQRLLVADGVPVGWSYRHTEDFDVYKVFYVTGREA